MDFDIGTCTLTGYSAEGWFGVQIDPYGGADGGSAPYPVIGAYGIIGRPLQPTNDIGAQVLYCQQGHDGFAWVGGDPRDIARLPELTEGSAVLYNARGAFHALDYETETATLYVPLDDSSKAHCLVLGKDPEGKRTVSLIHSDGFAVLMTEDALILKNKSGNAYIELNADGIVINGNVKQVGGLDVGGGVALPLVIQPALAAWWGAISSAVNAQGATPLTGVTLGGVLAAATAALAATGTTLTKGV